MSIWEYRKKVQDLERDLQEFAEWRRKSATPCPADAQDPSTSQNAKPISRLSANPTLEDSGSESRTALPAPVTCPHCREILEIYAGMEGYTAHTSLEQYLHQILLNMVHAALAGAAK